MIPPLLRSARCTLSVVREDYLDAHVAFLNDPEVNRYLRLRPPYTLEQQQKWRERVLSSPADVVFAILVGEAGEERFIGVMGLHEINTIDRSARTGAVIGDKRFWDKGIATEAKRLVLRHAFDVLRLERVWSAVAEDNRRSRRSLEKSGYRCCGKRPRAAAPGEPQCDEILYEISLDMWSGTQS